LFQSPIRHIFQWFHAWPLRSNLAWPEANRAGEDVRILDLLSWGPALGFSSVLALAGAGSSDSFCSMAIPFLRVGALLRCLVLSALCRSRSLRSGYHFSSGIPSPASMEAEWASNRPWLDADNCFSHCGDA